MRLLRGSRRESAIKSEGETIRCTTRPSFVLGAGLDWELMMVASSSVGRGLLGQRESRGRRRGVELGGVESGAGGAWSCSRCGRVLVALGVVAVARHDAARKFPWGNVSPVGDVAEGVFARRRSRRQRAPAAESLSVDAPAPPNGLAPMPSFVAMTVVESRLSPPTGLVGSATREWAPGVSGVVPGGCTPIGSSPRHGRSTILDKRAYRRTVSCPPLDSRFSAQRRAQRGGLSSASSSSRMSPFVASPEDQHHD